MIMTTMEVITTDFVYICCNCKAVLKLIGDLKNSGYTCPICSCFNYVETNSEDQHKSLYFYREIECTKIKLKNLLKLEEITKSK